MKLDSAAPTPEMLSVLKLASDGTCDAATVKAAEPVAPASTTQAKPKKAATVQKPRAKKPKTKSQTASASKASRKTVRKVESKPVKAKAKVAAKSKPSPPKSTKITR